MRPNRIHAYKGSIKQFLKTCCHPLTVSQLTARIHWTNDDRVTLRVLRDLEEEGIAFQENDRWIDKSRRK